LSQVVSSAFIPSSRFNEMVLKILCPLSPNPLPGLSRRCSRSSTPASTPYPLLQPSRPSFTRWCSIFHPYPPCLLCLHDLRILQVCFLQSYPPNSPSWSAHSSRVLQVCFALPSQYLLRVHFAPPSASPVSKFTSVYWVLPLFSMCSACQWWWQKKMKSPFPGPLCEAHSAFPSPLAVSKPMLYRVEGVQSMTAPALVPVI